LPRINDRAGMGAVATFKANLKRLHNVNGRFRCLRCEYQLKTGQMSSFNKSAEDADELESVDEIAPKKVEPRKAAKLLPSPLCADQSAGVRQQFMAPPAPGVRHGSPTQRGQ
jgi:hypothetical protein